MSTQLWVLLLSIKNHNIVLFDMLFQFNVCGWTIPVMDANDILVHSHHLIPGENFEGNKDGAQPLETYHLKVDVPN
jgi:hypothetical protein